MSVRTGWWCVGRGLWMLALLVSLWGVGCGDDASGGGASLDAEANNAANNAAFDGDNSAADIANNEANNSPNNFDDAPNNSPNNDVGSGESSTPGGDGGEPGESDLAGTLTAGEWRDLDHWEFWRAMMTGSEWAGMESYWTFNTEGRFAVEVVHEGLPVADATVQLFTQIQMLNPNATTPLWEARTDHQGRAELFSGFFEASSAPAFGLRIHAGQAFRKVEDLSPTGALEPIRIALDEAPAPENILDLMLVVDTTSSMLDELEFLQDELRDVIRRVREDNPESLQIRLSLVFYRDTTDAYIVRSEPFTDDIEAAIAALQDEFASGGGDYPEALSDALDAAFSEEAQWSSSARARLMLVVLDAPPHRDERSMRMLRDGIAQAARHGVRVVPVASSGVDKETEFLMRMMAIATGGTYVFLTDDSGVGNSHIEPTVGTYEVELLNNLLVRLINEAVSTPEASDE